MQTIRVLIGIICGIHSLCVAFADDAKPPRDVRPIAWGDIVNGLQLGIAPPVGTNGVIQPLFDGESVQADVFCRNAGDTAVRVLASVHTCLLGKGGNNALLASGIMLAPEDGGKPITVTYQGWNHLSLLDTRRKKGERPQKTLNSSFGGKTDIKLSEEDARRMTTVLEPGQTGSVVRVRFTPDKKPRSWWWLADESDTLPPGTYRVTAFFTADLEASEWKGTVESGSLELEVPPGGSPAQGNAGTGDELEQKAETPHSGRHGGRR